MPENDDLTPEEEAEAVTLDGPITTTGPHSDVTGDHADDDTEPVDESEIDPDDEDDDQ